MVDQLTLDKVDSPEFLDTLYTLLADSHRRTTLRYLLTSRQPVSRYRLAIEVAANEHGVSAEEVTGDQVEDVLVRFTHVHIPMLRDTGLVTWDRSDDQISLTPLMDHLSATVSHSSGLLNVSLSDRIKS